MTDVIESPTVPCEVRFGVPADVHHFMDLCGLCAEENGLTGMSIEKVLGEVWASLNNDHGLVGVIGEVGRPLEGGVLLRVDNTSYSYEPILVERAIFVHPSYRGGRSCDIRGGHARRLCEFAKNCSDVLDMPLLIGILTSERAKGKVRLYERIFGEPNGAYWLVNAKTGLKKNAAE